MSESSIMNVHSFSEFAEDEQVFDGAKERIENILNKEIIILKFKVSESKYKDSNSKTCATMQFVEVGKENERKIVFTGSNVIIELLQKYKEQLPFKTVIKKIDRFYTLT